MDTVLTYMMERGGSQDVVEGSVMFCMSFWYEVFHEVVQ
jgi:hypothetical protein